MCVEGTSVRKLDLPALSRAEQIEQLRAQMEQMGGAPQAVTDNVVTVPGELGELLPGGGLARGAVTQISDTPALVVELIDRVTADGGHVGVVGWPELSYAGVAALGNVIAVPDPGMDPLGIAGVLVDGMDLVVYRSKARLELSPVRARPLLGKLRKGTAALAMVGATVASPALMVTGDVAGFVGIGRGSGRITGIDLRVCCQGKGMASRAGTVTLGEASERPALRAVP